MRRSERLRRNAESKLHADNDGQPWSDEDLEWLALWDGTEAELIELAEILGRTIEACREQFYVRRRQGWVVTITTTTTTTVTATREDVCPRCRMIHARAQKECE